MNNIKVECLTCLEIKDIVFIFDCDVGHSMCLQCFIAYSEDAPVNQRFALHSIYGYTIKCPAGCDGSEVKDTEHLRVLGAKRYEQYQFFATGECLRQMGGIYCPAPGCNNGLVPNLGQRKIECNECCYAFCVNCRSQYHSGKCVTADNAYKSCPHCKVAVENSACSHVTYAFCKFEFCYWCLVEWNGNCQATHWFSEPKSAAVEVT